MAEVLAGTGPPLFVMGWPVKLATEISEGGVTPSSGWMLIWPPWTCALCAVLTEPVNIQAAPTSSPTCCAVDPDGAATKRTFSNCVIPELYFTAQRQYPGTTGNGSDDRGVVAMTL
jgi:hypothetical protein